MRTIILYIIFFLIGFEMMGQKAISISAHDNVIAFDSNECNQAAVLLKSWLDKAIPTHIEISKAAKEPTVFLKIDSSIPQQSFEISSDEHTVFLKAPDSKWLCYAAATFLEQLGFRRFTATVSYVPETNSFAFPSNYKKSYKPSFEYRALAYPDTYDESFRDWHKLDWIADDFGIWGHSFDKLLPPKSFFKEHPEYFALYEGRRHEESLCMSNDTVRKIVSENLKKKIAQKPDAKFYSISQNDDVIYCECPECKKLNEKYGGPQGALYYFLNRLAKEFPTTRITTLAYLHTYKPPKDLIIAPNIYTVFCPIELNRGKPIADDSKSKNFRNTLANWSKITNHLYLWDYTVQFSNYVSPFPNIHTFSENYKLFRKNKVSGIFAQGYSDVPGDFSELRQYILAKLLWDTTIDIEAVINDFLRGYYGKAAPYIKQYLDLLTLNQQKSNRFLDIYSGPVQSRKSFLTVENMTAYDEIISKAAQAVERDDEILNRIEKVRSSLEFAYFEQSKFYGKDPHGMFVSDENGERKVRARLTERVQRFTEKMKSFGLYELSEGGIKPDTYLENWVEISKTATPHLGEKATANFITLPSDDFKGKGEYGLTDGIKGHTDFNLNWIGWYGTDPEIELQANGTVFDKIQINFLEDQRHWIFPPEKITLSGFLNGQWIPVTEHHFEPLTENYTVNIKSFDYFDKSLSKFTMLKITVGNQKEVPAWRKRKSKKPMVMLDEIQLYDSTKK